MRDGAPYGKRSQQGNSTRLRTGGESIVLADRLPPRQLLHACPEFMITQEYDTAGDGGTRRRCDLEGGQIVPIFGLAPMLPVG